MIIRREDQQKPIADICGIIRTLSSGHDAFEGNVVSVIMTRPSLPHFHKVAKEFYYLVYGAVRIIVGAEASDISAGSLVLIPPKKVHYVVPRGESKFIVFSTPAWAREDQYIAQSNLPEFGYTEGQEKSELIRELFMRRTRARYIARTGRHEEESAAQDPLKTADHSGRDYHLALNKLSIPELRGLLAKQEKESKSPFLLDESLGSLEGMIQTMKNE